MPLEDKLVNQPNMMLKCTRPGDFDSLNWVEALDLDDCGINVDVSNIYYLSKSQNMSQAQILFTPCGFVAIQYSGKIKKTMQHCFFRSFLSHAMHLSNGLPSTVFPGRYVMDTFEKLLYLHLKGRQRTC